MPWLLYSWGKEFPVPNECAKVKVKLSVCLTKHHTMKTYRGIQVQLHTFLTLALYGGEWQGNSPLYPLDQRLARPQSWYGHDGEQKKSHHCSNWN
jgi:hypothetical protein